MKKRIFFIIIGIQILFLLAALLLYRSFAAQFIKAMYDGASAPFLNSFVHGQAEMPALFYVFKADRLFLKFFLSAIFFIFFEIVIFTTARLAIFRKFRVAFVIGIIVLIPALYVLRYGYLLHKLRGYNIANTSFYKEKKFPGLKPDQVMMLGNAHTQSNHPENSYIEYSKKKKPDTIRIGVFGCSFVEGTEAARGHDLASFLEDRFDKAGIKNIEVINFGVSGYGIHQMYLLWEFIGKDYELDYVVFMPFSWHKTRDNTFIYASDSYGPIHARFIIKNGEIELIPVSGATRPEACKIYHRITPPLRYILYDNHMPLFLKALLPSVLHKRSNPFYYKKWKSKKSEILTTYRILFEKLSKSTPNFIVICNDNKIYNLRDQIQQPNIHFIKSRTPEFFNFLYFAKGHNSALGNQMRADEFFTFFMNYPKPKIETLKVSCEVWEKKRDFIPSGRPLYEYDKLSVDIGEGEAATFLAKRPHPYENLDFRKYKIESLLLLPPGEDIKLVTFVPLDFLLKDNKPVFLSFRRGDNSFKAPIGFINAQASVLGKWELELDKNGYFVKHGSGWAFEIKNSNFFLETNPKIKNIYITTNGNRILKTVSAYRNSFLHFLGKFILGKNALIFKPLPSDFACLRAKPGQFADIDNLAGKEGTLDLVLSGKNGRKKQYPIFSYKSEKINL